MHTVLFFPVFSNDQFDVTSLQEYGDAQAC